MPEFPRIDKYASMHSPLHDWDPRIKLLSIMFLIFLIATVKDVKASLFGLCFALILLYTSRLPSSFVREYLSGVAVFIVFVSITLALTVPGKELAGFYHVKITSEGLETASLVAVRAFTAILLGFTMMATTRFTQLVKALENLRIPNKLIQAFIFTYRYIFVLIHETRRMSTSLKARGFRKKTNVKTLKVIGNSIGMLFIRSHERAEQVYNAMLSRGYSGKIQTLNEFTLTRMDVSKGLFVVVTALYLSLS